MIKIAFLIVIPAIEIIIARIFIKTYHRRKTIIQTKTANIGFIQKGFYEIKGKVKSVSENLISPLSGIPCVYYNFTVEELTGSGSGKGRHWKKIIEDECCNTFAVADNSGEAIVKLSDSEKNFKVDEKKDSSTLLKATPQMKEALHKYHQSNSGIFFDKKLRYRETCLKEGDDLYILGEVQGFEENKPIFASGKTPLFISDKSEKELVAEDKLTLIFLTIILIALPFAELYLLVY